MREIKCRLWNPRLKQMSEPFTLEDLLLATVPLLHKTTAGEGVEWLLFIGLKDKNGKSGYDGDLAVWNNHLYQITWDNEYSCWQMKLLRKEQALLPSIPLHNLAKSEIIGNVHENPELLEASLRP